MPEVNKTIANDLQDERGDERLDRRAVLAAIAGIGIGTAVFERALAQQLTASSAVTSEMIQQAEWVAGLELAEEDRAAVAGRVQSALQKFEEMRKVEVGYDVPPACLASAARHSALGSGDPPRRWVTICPVRYAMP